MGLGSIAASTPRSRAGPNEFRPFGLDGVMRQALIYEFPGPSCKKNQQFQPAGPL